MKNRMGMHFFVSGLVQGVWFRASTQDKAKELEVTGWVRNLPDGRVEGTAYGSQEALRELQEWLKKGPMGARVEQVVVEEVAWQENDRFAVL